VTGTARAGKNLRCTKGSWRNRPSRYRYAWRRGTGFIAGASKSTYRLANSDRGKRVSCMVFASSSYGQKAAQSRQVKVR
jgi:hypothetical protein